VLYLRAGCFQRPAAGESCDTACRRDSGRDNGRLARFLILAPPGRLRKRGHNGVEAASLSAAGAINRSVLDSMR
jgi:hypothetical protein